MLPIRLIPFTALLLSTSALAAGETELRLNEPLEGQLGLKDQQLSNGEFADFYDIDLRTGQTLKLEMRSTGGNLDPYLALIAPSGEQTDNEDWEDSSDLARIDWTAAESGAWRIIATSDNNAEYGPYTLLLSESTPIEESPALGPAPGEGAFQEWTGRLEKGDSLLNSGEFADYFDLEGVQGEQWILDLRSTDFDPYLGVKLPSDSDGPLHNDDFEGDRNRSLIRFVLPETGAYRVQVTSYQAKEDGSYHLSLTRGEPQGDSENAPEVSSNSFSGSLGEGDDTLSGGEWFETHSFQGLPGQRVQVEMTGEFDTYLILSGPQDFKIENDDGPEGSERSALESVLPESGTYTFVATSYEAGQGGSYTISVESSTGTLEFSNQRDLTRIENGQVTQGQLQDGDFSLEDGEHVDLYAMDVEPGHLLQITLESTEFDPYLVLELPDGGKDSNDDWEGDRNLSRIEIPVTQAGQVRIGATSYRPGESGHYTLKAMLTPYKAPPPPADAISSSDSDIYGIFVGISNYAGDVDDLELTAEDANKLHVGLRGIGMREENSRKLIDHQATRANLIATIEELGSKMGEEDTLVLFYSGHGNRIAREEFQRQDADNIDETLTLYDGEYTDDELDALLTAHTRGKVLVVLDACFSGGFAKDVVSRPGRMGLFSSQEDATSAVADKFRAGGYLSQFFLEAVGEKRADADSNRQITALELSQYIYERYRTEVQEGPSGVLKTDDPLEDYVKASDNLSFQQLVVDRSGVTPSTVLFAW